MNTRLPRFIALLLAVSSLTPAAVFASTTDAGFTRLLSTADEAGSGLAKLTAEQRTALDAQIAREILSARQGDVVAFAKSFTARRTSQQIEAAGLAGLSNAERGQLDSVVARAVAQRPLVTLGRFSKKSDEVVETIRYRPQLHGEVSLTYGTAGKGREFYGGSFTTILEDPAHHLTVSFTYAEYHGKGLSPFGCCSPLACVR